MIVICNIGGELTGISKYQVWVNEEIICEFEHNRMEGLGMCLLKASKAVEKSKWNKVETLYKKLKDIE